jgi:hypothetical protein
MYLKIRQLACGHVSLFNYFMFSKFKISIVKVSNIRMMTHGTPWNVH